jgi:hypothetical protein
MFTAPAAPWQWQTEFSFSKDYGYEISAPDHPFFIFAFGI